MDRLDAMTVLLAVVEHGSLSAASRQLRVPLATVSRKVSDLETHLRAALIIRTNRKIGLTEAGRAYVEAAREILDAGGGSRKDRGGRIQHAKGRTHPDGAHRLRPAAPAARHRGFSEGLSRISISG